MTTWLDTHHHFDFLDGLALRRAMLAALPETVRLVAQTLLPSDFFRLHGQAGELDLGTPRPPLWSVGLHPWWVASASQVRDELELMASALERTRFVGEIGLDHTPRRLEQAPEALQRKSLDGVLELACAAAPRWESQGPVVLSIHAVRSAGAVLDALEGHDAQARGVVAVFHRFGGTSDELARLLRMGGHVSVHPAMVETRRGRGTIRQVPDDRLLLETDLPTAPVAAGECVEVAGRRAAEAVCRGLSSVLEALVELRGPGLVREIERTQARLYGLVEPASSGAAGA